MLVQRDELVDLETREEGQSAFTSDPLPINKHTCALDDYGALAQLVEVRIEYFLLNYQLSS